MPSHRIGGAIAPVRVSLPATIFEIVEASLAHHRIPNAAVVDEDLAVLTRKQGREGDPPCLPLATPKGRIGRGPLLPQIVRARVRRRAQGEDVDAHGRALALEGAVANAQAILATWFLGTETGNAIADVLFGAYGPSGRLPASFPRASGQEPYYYAHKTTGRPNPPGPLQPYKAHFRNIPNSALYPFGHGLTYGKIEYAELTLGSPTLAMNGQITISARITNRGMLANERERPLLLPKRGVFLYADFGTL